MRSRRPRVGDVVEIPLPSGRKAYAQYVFQDHENGPLIQVFDLVSEHSVQIDAIRQAKPLFPPVITGLFGAVRTGLWKVVGRLPVDDFAYPRFLWPLYDDKVDKVVAWNLWDGQKRIPIGRKLPRQYRELEQLVVWAPEDVAERIESGENPLDFILDR